MSQHPRIQKIARILLEIDRMEKNEWERYLIKITLAFVLIKTTLLAAKNPSQLTALYKKQISDCEDTDNASN